MSTFCITIFEIIYQGPRDIITFNIQNEKVGVNGEKFQYFSHGASLWKSKKLWCLKNAVVDILKYTLLHY